MFVSISLSLDRAFEGADIGFEDQEPSTEQGQGKLCPLIMLNLVFKSIMYYFVLHYHASLFYYQTLVLVAIVQID